MTTKASRPCSLAMRRAYLHEIEQSTEPPGDRVQPLGPRVGPAWVHQLGEVTVGEVGGSSSGRVVLLRDVAGSEVADAQKVAGTLDVALLLGGEGGQPRASQALLSTFPSWTEESHRTGSEWSVPTLCHSVLGNTKHPPALGLLRHGLLLFL